MSDKKMPCENCDEMIDSWAARVGDVVFCHECCERYTFDKCSECGEVWCDDDGFWGDERDGYPTDKYPNGYLLCASCILEIPHFWVLHGVL